MPIELGLLALIAAGAVVIVSLFYFLMAFGWRRGEFVWGGRHPRRLPPQLRQLSLFFGVLLIAGAGSVALLSEEVGVDLIPTSWVRSTSLVATAFFVVTGLTRVFRGATLERYLVGPVLLAAGVVSALIGFA